MDEYDVCWVCTECEEGMSMKTPKKVADAAKRNAHRILALKEAGYTIQKIQRTIGVSIDAVLLVLGGEYDA